MNFDITRRFLEAFKSHWARFLARGKSIAVDDSKTIQRVTALSTGGAVLAGVEHFVGYGDIRVPPDGSEVLFVFPAGDHETGFAIGTDNPAHRVKNCEAGERGLYTIWNTGTNGHRILLKKGRTLEARSAYLDAQFDGLAFLGSAGEIRFRGATIMLYDDGGSLIASWDGTIWTFHKPVKINGNLTQNGNVAIDGNVNQDGDMNIEGGLDVGGVTNHAARVNVGTALNRQDLYVYGTIHCHDIQVDL